MTWFAVIAFCTLSEGHMHCSPVFRITFPTEKECEEGLRKGEAAYTSKTIGKQSFAISACTTEGTAL